MDTVDEILEGGGSRQYLYTLATVVKVDADTEKFERFLIEMDDVVEAFVESLAAKGYQLDGSLVSLDELERFFLEEVAKQGNEATERYIQRGARYLGEVLRETYGGQWRLENGDPRDINYGLPVIYGHSVYPVSFAPHEILRNFVFKKKPGLLRRAISSHINPQPLNLVPEADGK